MQRPERAARSPRRDFLKQATVAGTLACLRPAGTLVATMPVARRPRVAAIFTVMRFRSHAYNILENFFEPYLFRGRFVDPGVDVVSLYADQIPAAKRLGPLPRDRRELENPHPRNSATGEIHPWRWTRRREAVMTAEPGAGHLQRKDKPLHAGWSGLRSAGWAAVSLRSQHQAAVGSRGVYRRSRGRSRR